MRNPILTHLPFFHLNTSTHRDCHTWTLGKHGGSLQNWLLQDPLKIFGQWNSPGTVCLTLLGPSSQRGIGRAVGTGRMRASASSTLISPRSSCPVISSSSAWSAVKCGRGQMISGGPIVGRVIGFTVAIVRLSMSCATCRCGRDNEITLGSHCTKFDIFWTYRSGSGKRTQEESCNHSCSGWSVAFTVLGKICCRYSHKWNPPASYTLLCTPSHQPCHCFHPNCAHPLCCVDSHPWVLGCLAYREDVLITPWLASHW